MPYGLPHEAELGDVYAGELEQQEEATFVGTGIESGKPIAHYLRDMGGLGSPCCPLLSKVRGKADERLRERMPRMAWQRHARALHHAGDPTRRQYPSWTASGGCPPESAGSVGGNPPPMRPQAESGRRAASHGARGIRRGSQGGQ